MTRLQAASLRIRHALATVLVLGACLLGQGLAADERLLRIGVQRERPPFSFVDDEDRLRGFDVEIAHTLCDMLEVRCQLGSMNFAALIPALRDRRIDAAVASMSVTEQRLQLVDFTTAYFQAPNRFVARRGAPVDVAPEALAGTTIGVKQSTTHDRYLTDIYAEVATIRRYAHEDEIYIDLALDRLDHALGDGITFRESFLKTALGTDFEFVGPALSNPRWFGRGEAIAVRKGDVDLLARLNAALEELRAEGFIEEIAARHFDYDLGGHTAPAAEARSPVR